jgi:hypothetical protein
VQSLEWSLTGDSFLVTTGTATSKVHWRDETHTQRCGNTYCRTEQLLHYSPLTYSAILTMVGSTRQYSAVLGRARQCTSEHTALSLSADAPLSACGPPVDRPPREAALLVSGTLAVATLAPHCPSPALGCCRMCAHVCPRWSRTSPTVYALQRVCGHTGAMDQPTHTHIPRAV